MRLGTRARRVLATSAVVLPWLAFSCGRIGYDELSTRAPTADSGKADTGSSTDASSNGDAVSDGALESALEDGLVQSESGTEASIADSAADSATEDSGPLPIPSGQLGRGFHQTCFIKAGRLSCWGANDTAQLGLGDLANRTLPAPIGSASDWVDMCGGEYHSCALRASGALYCWGRNDHGQLGIGSVVNQTTPARLSAFSDFNQVTCGGQYTCASRRNGALYCWGENLEGALGLADLDGAPDPTSPQLVAAVPTFASVSAGQGHTCAIRGDGALFCWGRNSDGELGLGTAGGHLRSAARVGTDTNWSNIAAGQGQTCGVRSDGSLWCWGIDAAGTLGLDVPDATVVKSPTRVGVLNTWQKVSASRLHTCAVTRDGALYCWGRGVEGQLGSGFIAERRTPTRVGTETTWRDVGVGGFHTCGRRADFSVWCWGENVAGQLGLGDTTRRPTPASVTIP